MFMCMCVYTCGSYRTTSSAILQALPTFFETRTLPWSELAKLGWIASTPQGLPISIHMTLGWQVTMTGFLMWIVGGETWVFMPGRQELYYLNHFPSLRPIFKTVFLGFRRQYLLYHSLPTNFMGLSLSELLQFHKCRCS